IPEYLKAIDVIVSRAVATTIAEITALGIPSVLIPIPYVTANHQEVNARSLGQQDAAIVLKETEITGEKLIAALDRIVLNE
ncbi:undecaprenyldiphospho-muramoylpentapeptide beta-N-acetylglucosaminyltransferase, partial [Bacillus vallismortis]|nr:undecaprenyldiphospho-muramoylpentapeptide beta-N-acetylglucosaminyltransferase [Bacillus vallismortis]